MSPSVPVPPKKPNRWALFLLLVAIFGAGAVAIVFSVSGWIVSSPGKKLQNPVPPTEQAVDDGMFNYMKHCQSCHGQDGDGNGQRAENLSIKPADFTNASLMSEHTDGELYWQITHGRPPMPGFESKLTDQERWELVDYIRSLAKKTGATNQAAGTPSGEHAKPAEVTPSKATPAKN